MTEPATGTPHRRRSRGTRPGKPTPTATPAPAAATPRTPKPSAEPQRTCEYAPGLFGTFDRAVSDPDAVLLATARQHINGRGRDVHVVWRVVTVDGGTSVDCTKDHTMRTLLVQLAHRQTTRMHRVPVLRLITGATLPNPRYRPPSTTTGRAA